jgi:hypothetical protein
MRTQTRGLTGSRADVAAASAALGLFAAAAVADAILHSAGHPVRAGTAPLSAEMLRLTRSARPDRVSKTATRSAEPLSASRRARRR